MHQLQKETITSVSPIGLLLINVILFNVSLKCIFIIANQIPDIVKRNCDVMRPNIELIVNIEQKLLYILKEIHRMQWSHCKYRKYSYDF